jgi:DNA-binding beta-propeller fold protein YncE
MRPLLIFILALCAATGFLNAQPKNDDLVTLSSPAGNLPVAIHTNGKTVIPNGRFITPYGKTFQVAPHPFGLVLSNDGKIAVTANSGTSPISISIAKNINTGTPQIQQIPPGPSSDEGVLASVFMGLAISPDNKMVYVAGGQTNRIYLFSIATGAKLDSIDCSISEKGAQVANGYIGDMTLSSWPNVPAASRAATANTFNFI